MPHAGPAGVGSAEERQPGRPPGPPAPAPAPHSLHLGACSEEGQKVSRPQGVCCSFRLLSAVSAGIAASVLLRVSVRRAVPTRCLKVCSQRRAGSWSVGNEERLSWGYEGAPCWSYWLAEGPDPTEPSSPLRCRVCGSCWGPLPGMWGLHLAGSAAPGRSTAGAAARTPGAVCDDASACVEVSVAYVVLNFAFGNGGSLIALWCISVSLLRSEALGLQCFFPLE